MMISCMHGHLHVCKWLFHAGAAADAHTLNSQGASPLARAVACGQAAVAHWLFIEAGADLKAPDARLHTPLKLATFRSRNELVLWLVLHGAACDERGHVDPNILDRDVSPFYPDMRRALCVSLRQKISEHFAFTGSILAGVLAPGAAKRRHVVGLPPCKLPLLQGHEGTVLKAVASFSGIECGRRLRIAQEAAALLHVSEQRAGRGWS